MISALGYLLLTCGALAQVGQIPAWPPKQFIASGGPTLTYIGTNTLTLTTPNGTVAGAAIGTPSADRLVVVVVWLVANNTQSTSMTIGGVTATLASQNTINGILISIFYANVPTGTTATINWVSTGFSAASTPIDIYTISGESSQTPTGVGQASASTGTVVTTPNFSTSANGVAIVAAGEWFSATSLAVSASSGTPTLDHTYSSGGFSKATSFRGLSASASSNFTGTWNAINAAGIVAAAWF